MSKILIFPTATKIVNTGRIHICNVCGKKDTWKDGWRWKYIFHKGSGNSDPGWDEIFKTCTEECREGER